MEATKDLSPSLSGPDYLQVLLHGPTQPFQILLTLELDSNEIIKPLQVLNFKSLFGVEKAVFLHCFT